MIEAKLTQGNLLKKILEAIKDLVTDANFDCSPTGISLQAMDSSHVSLVHMLLRSEVSNRRRVYAEEEEEEGGDVCCLEEETEREERCLAALVRCCCAASRSFFFSLVPPSHFTRALRHTRTVARPDARLSPHTPLSSHTHTLCPFAIASVFQGFEHYRCDRNVSLGINMANISKILKCCGNDDSVTLKSDENADHCTFVFESEGACGRQGRGGK